MSSASSAADAAAAAASKETSLQHAISLRAPPRERLPDPLGGAVGGHRNGAQGQTAKTQSRSALGIKYKGNDFLCLKSEERLLFSGTAPSSSLTATARSIT